MCSLYFCMIISYFMFLTLKIYENSVECSTSEREKIKSNIYQLQMEILSINNELSFPSLHPNVMMSVNHDIDELNRILRNNNFESDFVKFAVMDKLRVLEEFKNITSQKIRLLMIHKDNLRRKLQVEEANLKKYED
ncbi:hypothetical protein EDEG_01314 [Edhazardia aedis USNM 41457]|uniref:VPS37 C-terminal domain-containing protein n=1 Tax=Edhazardia aedis (strain USNM 41457) TaxID=1003232 RepID=J9DAA7_EDHAE|nr:hypothetical protein EDEG_01314 [Edhazardia aedis USNM 41457]|eukprot:EJW04444.1 hypothetical protein EDEG_01314 [Edhazardia aedis USNM 41457]